MYNNNKIMRFKYDDEGILYKYICKGVSYDKGILKETVDFENWLLLLKEDLILYPYLPFYIYYSEDENTIKIR
jgi:hypothetical protein